MSNELINLTNKLFEEVEEESTKKVEKKKSTKEMLLDKIGDGRYSGGALAYYFFREHGIEQDIIHAHLRQLVKQSKLKREKEKEEGKEVWYYFKE